LASFRRYSAYHANRTARCDPRAISIRRRADVHGRPQYRRPADPRLGTREGQVIPSAWGGRILVQRYQPAPSLAQDYVQKRYCRSATNFQGGIISGQTQDLNQQFGPIAQAEGKRVHLDAGEVSFKCGAQDGYVYAITLQAWQQGGPVSLWVVYA
jgi:hypothetical protein